VQWRLRCPWSKMKREILVDTLESQERRVAVVEDSKLEEYSIERVGTRRYIGTIYKGRVINMVPAIQAAFIDVGLEKNAFLHIDDVEASAADAEDAEGDDTTTSRNRRHTQIGEVLKEGQELLVQVVKAPMGTKGVRVTSNVSLPGRFLVFLPYEEQIAVSRKIRQPEERKRLNKLAREVKLPKGCGLIVRTAGEGVSREAFQCDAQYLINLWKSIEKKNSHVQPPACVHEELDLVQRIIRDSYSEEVTRVVFSDKAEYDRAIEFVQKMVPGARGELELYQGTIPLFEKWEVQRDIERSFRRIVWLKCGGYIVIDPTEALVAIDVNSGRHVSAENLEDTVARTNIEAADEIARQLRLRNIGGLVVIDFIDMRNRKNQRDVLQTLQNALSKDKAKSSILPISEFGLVEMTRQRMKASTHSSVYDECPYCKGRGNVKSVLSVCIDIHRALCSYLTRRREKSLRVELCSLVMESVRENITIFKRIENEYTVELTFVAKEDMHTEDFVFKNHISGKILKQNT
jgi:ribonuclease G